MNRQKTNSITHLVKIVAEEVLEENFERLMSNYEESKRPKAEKYPNRAGDPWEPYERESLRREFEDAINSIALNHNRTFGAIRERIRQEGLL